MQPAADKKSVGYTPSSIRDHTFALRPPVLLLSEFPLERATSYNCFPLYFTKSFLKQRQIIKWAIVNAPTASSIPRIFDKEPLHALLKQEAVGRRFIGKALSYQLL